MKSSAGVGASWLNSTRPPSRARSLQIHLTHAKKALPKTVLSTSNSNLVGTSVSMPSSPRNCTRRVTKGCEGVSFPSRTDAARERVEAHLVVLNVILLEHHGKGHPDGHIGEDGEEAVGLDASEGEVVGNLVHGEESVLVGGTSDGPGEEPEPWGPEGGVAERVGRAELDESDQEDDVFRQGFVAHQLADLSETCVSSYTGTCASRREAHLGMSLEDGLPPSPVGLLRHHPQEVGVILGRIHHFWCPFLSYQAIRFAGRYLVGGVFVVVRTAVAGRD